MNKLEQAARQALEALQEYRDTQMIKAPRRAITALREALAEPDTDTMLWDSVEPRKKAEQEPSCNQHPDAPHGFARNASHNAGRYVCECEGWEPDQTEQEPVGEMIDKAGYKGAAWYLEPPATGIKLYTAPVRTKDLSDDELNKLLDYWSEDERSAYGGAWASDGEYVDMKSFARAVIAADREKNK